MTDYPCLADTESVALAIDGTTLVPTLNVDPDPSNALSLHPNGLYAPSSVMAGTRIYALVPQAVGAGAQITFGNMRWQSSNASWTGSTIVPQVSGLWLFGACINLDTAAGAFSATAFLLGIGATTVTLGADTAASVNTFTASPTTVETIALNPCGMANLEAGVAVQCNLQHNSGPSLNTVIVEAAGVEMWGHLLRPAT